MIASDCTCWNEGQVARDAADVVDEAEVLLRAHFRRAEASQHAGDYLRGLLAEVERKNGWQLAEQAGYAHPRTIQRVLDRYAWDADAVRDDLRRYVIAELGHPAGILVVDETGFPKQGKHSAGVARQYSGTLGKVANCQVGVFLGYVSPSGHVALDRELFIPQEWFTDRERCRTAGIPEEVSHRTKPQLALTMIERALDGGVPAAWVTGDEVYGSAGQLRRALEARGYGQGSVGYVLAVRSNESVTTWPPYGAPGQTRVGPLTAAIPPEAWHRLSCGEGAQGPRVYDWAWVPLRPALREGWVHAVLLRRHPERPEEVAYYLAYAPAGTLLEELVRVAGARWSIDDLFKLAKGQVGLDHYEVRSWHGWYRHITLALLALTVLTVAAQKKGGLRVRSISQSRSRRSAGSSSGSFGPPSAPQTTSPPGPAGVVTTRRSRRNATSVAA
ncbi:MAG: IS701 family transposase [Chloroflexota bacterium]